MSFSSIDITLNIKNNTNYVVPISILGNNYNLRDTSNSTIEYRWDFTSFVFTNQNQILIQYKLNTETEYTIYSGEIATQTLQAIVDVLNNLGIGFFELYTESGSTYIGTYNDNYTFGQINVFAPSGLTAINPYFLIGSGFQTSAGGISTLGFVFVDSANNIFVSASESSGVTTNLYSYNGTVLSGKLIKLLPDGTLDTNFTCLVDYVSGTTTQSIIQTMVEQPDGKYIIGGYFNQIGASTQQSIARINADGSLDNTFAVGTGCTQFPYVASQPARVGAIAIDSNLNRVIVGGNFNMYDVNLISGAGTQLIALDDTGNLLPVFPTGTVPITHPNPGSQIGFQSSTNNGVNKIEVYNNQYYVASEGYSLGTYYNDVAPYIYGSFVVFNNDGTVANNPSLEVGFTSNNTIVPFSAINSNLKDFVITSDGSIILVGVFMKYFNGTNFGSAYANGLNIQKLSSAFVFDTAYQTSVGLTMTSAANVPIGNMSTNSLVIQNDDKVIVVGRFAEFNGTTSNGIARLNTDGTYDTTFLIGNGCQSVPSAAPRIFYNNGIITYEYKLAGTNNLFDGVPYNGIVQLLQ